MQEKGIFFLKSKKKYSLNLRKKTLKLICVVLTFPLPLPEIAFLRPLEQNTVEYLLLYVILTDVLNHYKIFIGIDIRSALCSVE